jgi:hypothetical protein
MREIRREFTLENCNQDKD